jgi:peptidoglycan/xylan/chitin deacetylase (PgdA/CDA1 family)
MMSGKADDGASNGLTLSDAAGCDAAGSFVISLDFELFWGIRDHVDLESCKARLEGTREAIPRLLDLFAAHDVHATWATVGFLFFDDKDELLAHLPSIRPGYRNRRLSPYDDIDRMGPDERSDPYHYGRSLVRRIAACPGQEIGTHTFSHYYCLEEGQTAEAFRADLEAARAAAKLLDVELKSLVFPRNQWRSDYLDICAEAGIAVVRGNERAWMYRAQTEGAGSLPKRVCRLADSYINLSGHHAARPSSLAKGVIDVPSSRFLRPFSARLAAFESRRLQRICAGMSHAAAKGLTYHLWWHPHNFGLRQDDNFKALSVVLDHFRTLAGEQGMASRAMGELIPAASAPGGIEQSGAKKPQRQPLSCRRAHHRRHT